MKDENIEELDDAADVAGEASLHSSYQVPKEKNMYLSGMYQNWFLD